jgi:hypothetical protein
MEVMNITHQFRMGFDSIRMQLALAEPRRVCACISLLIPRWPIWRLLCGLSTSPDYEEGSGGSDDSNDSNDNADDCTSTQ